ncbi:class I SAM-dependent methyltransferase [bacterium]|jgi:SAM-dependent methyltransferase|nr:class I SAM-dependent methyltransferase [bacterium]
MEDVNGFTVFQWIMIVMLAFGCIHYLWLVWEDRYGNDVITIHPNFLYGKEGFSNPHGITDSELSRTIWFENDELFDEFYASVYDNLTQLAGRYPRELALIMTQWKKTTSVENMDVLDCGCGTGIATVLFAKQGVNSVVGLDKSEYMLRRARNVTILAADLPKEQREAVQFIQGDMMQEFTFSPGQFSHACLLFFTAYYAGDTVGLFRNLFHWIRPGGQLAIEVVNKYKFDPMLESASPFTGISMQKYSKKRITKSKVEFDKFSYEAEFDLKDPDAEFRETFRFKDKSVRRQRHTMNMKDIHEMVKLAQNAGWNYNGYIDLITAGFEYAYVLMFTHP